MAATTPRTTKSRTRKPARRQPRQLIDFSWGGEKYTLDLQGDRVYRNWMAVETNQGFTILGAYRASTSATA
jgi:hypothetical protein